MGDGERLLTAAAGRLDDVEKNPPDCDGHGGKEAELLPESTSQRRSCYRPRRALDHLRALSWPKRVALFVLCVVLGRSLCRLPTFLSPSLVGNAHPIPQLIERAEAEHARRSAAEPKTLEEAYALYRARHGRPPPKGYDAWFFYARRSNACRIGGFDELYSSLKIWWGVDPREIRERTERLGNSKNHALGRVRIRQGQMVTWEEMRQQGIGRGAEAMDDAEPRTALEEMLGRLIEGGVHLPDGKPLKRVLSQLPQRANRDLFLAR